MNDARADLVASEALDKPDPADHTADVVVAGRQRDTHMGFARSVATLLFIIALPVALVTTNIRLLANAPVVYDYSFDRYDAEDATGLSRGDLDATAASLRAYFNNSEPTFYHSVTDGGLPSSVFNARETRHMEDVKTLFVWMNRVQAISVIFVLAYIVAFFVWARDSSLRQLATQSLVGLGLGVAIIGGVGIFAAFGFEAASTRFHELFFNNDLWLLDPERDHLIQMFPEAFWRDITIVLGAICALEAALIGAIAGIYVVSTRGERRRVTSAIDVNASNTQAA